MTYLNTPQLNQLLQGVNPKRVHNLRGMSHMEAYDIRAHLNRVFGFARWSADVISMELLYERHHQNKGGKDAVSVGYRAGLTLAVHSPEGDRLATYTEYAAGSASSFPVAKQADAHDMAIKTAESQALKRAAINLGDQFGLSLYNNGSPRPIVLDTLVIEREEKPVDEDAPEVVPGADAMPDVPDGEEWQPSRDWVAEMREAVAAGADRDKKNEIYAGAVAEGAPSPYLDNVRRAGRG